MPQFDYLGTWRDSWTILGAILSPGDASLVPDLNYEQSQPLVMTTLDESLKEFLKEHRSLYVWSEMFSKHPPCLRKIESGINAGRYWIDVTRGGPLLHLTLPACYRYDAHGVPIPAPDGGSGLQLGAGILSYQREYLNPETEVWEVASAGVKAGYLEIVRRMKTQLVRHRFHVPIWAGVDALREIRENKATIHGFGLS